MNKEPAEYNWAWIVIDRSTDKMFIDSLRQTRTEAIEAYADKYGADAWLKNDSIDVILIELREISSE